jgi:argininosuccinate synthase
MSSTPRIVLADSGGVGSSAAIPWLKERHRAEVVVVIMDLGQGRDLEEVRDRALAAGVVRAHVLDLRDEFARDFIAPAIKADAVTENRSPLTAQLAHPLIAKTLVDIASLEEAGAVAHGGSGLHTEGAILGVDARALEWRLPVIAPAHEWTMSRGEAIGYARRIGLSIPGTLPRAYRTESNLWGRSIAIPGTEGTWTEPPEEMYTLTKPSAQCPDEPAYVELRFERGLPTAINGVPMSLLDLIASLTTIAGAHGVGRTERIQRSETGLSAREICEAPAAVVLHAAHHELQTVILSNDVHRFYRAVSLQYADLIANGSWFMPLREALNAFVDKVQQGLTGVVRLRLFKGVCRTVDCKPTNVLLEHELAASNPIAWATSLRARPPVA